MKKYTVEGNGHIFAETNDILEALRVFRKLDKAGFDTKIRDQFGIIKE